MFTDYHNTDVNKTKHATVLETLQETELETSRARVKYLLIKLFCYSIKTKPFASTVDMVGRLSYYFNLYTRLNQYRS